MLGWPQVSEDEASALARTEDAKGTELVPIEGSALPDAYERDYMTGAGKILARHRMVSGWKFNGFMAGLSAFMLTGPILAGAMGTVAGYSALLATLWLGLAVLRVTVSEHHVNVQYAVFGPTIPLEAITSVAAIRYKALRHGGWGMRRRKGGRLYNMMGDGGHAVEINWLDEQGAPKMVTVGYREAEALAADIRAAMAAKKLVLAAADGEAKALAASPT